MTTVLRPNFEDPFNTAKDLVDNNITIYGYPTSWQQDVFNASDDPALRRLADTYHIPTTFHGWYYYLYYNVIEKGTHAYVHHYLYPIELSMGRWWRSTEHIPGMYPYGGWITRKNWYLNEVIFAIRGILWYFSE